MTAECEHEFIAVGQFGERIACQNCGVEVEEEIDNLRRIRSRVKAVCEELGINNDFDLLLDIIAAERTRAERAERALERIARDPDVVYLSCADLPFCDGEHDERSGRHDANCAIGIAREALGGQP